MNKLENVIFIFCVLNYQYQRSLALNLFDKTFIANF